MMSQMMNCSIGNADLAPRLYELLVTGSGFHALQGSSRHGALKESVERYDAKCVDKNMPVRHC